MQDLSRMFVSIIIACCPLTAFAESMVFERPEHCGPFESRFAAEGLKVVSDRHEGGQTWGSLSWKKSQWPSWNSKAYAKTAESPSPGNIHLENLLIIADKSSGWSVGVFDKFKSRHHGSTGHDPTDSHWGWGEFDGYGSGGHDSPSHGSGDSPTGSSDSNQYQGKSGYKNKISSLVGAFFDSLGNHGDHSSHSKPMIDKTHLKKLFGFTLGAFDHHGHGGSGGSHDDDNHDHKYKYKYWYKKKHKHDDPWMDPPDGTSSAPEPSSLMLLGVGSALALAWRRRRRR